MAGPGNEWIGKEEEKEVLDVIRAKWLFRYGDEKDPNYKHKVKTLEEEIEQSFKVKHALAVSSGTSALIVALSAAKVGPGDEVIVPGYTFIASISSIIICKAIPVLAEVDDSLTLNPEDVEARITPRTKAILAVHMIGNPCRIDRLKEIAIKHNLLLIEDTAQAFGGTYKGKKLGTYGDIGIYSFNIFKTINAGDGGLVVTNNSELYERAFGFHDQGHSPNRFGVEVGNRSIVGQNFRMNELTGAVVLAQFRKIYQILSRLKQVKSRLKSKIINIPGLSFRTINDVEGECFTLLTVFLRDKKTADKVAEKLGTLTMAHSGWHVYNNMEQILEKRTITDEGCPFTCPFYKGNIEYSRGMLPKTDALLERAINISVGVVDRGLGSAFGVHPHSTDAEIDRAASEFNKIAAEYL